MRICDTVGVSLLIRPSSINEVSFTGLSALPDCREAFLVSVTVLRRTLENSVESVFFQEAETMGKSVPSLTGERGISHSSDSAGQFMTVDHKFLFAIAMPVMEIIWQENNARQYKQKV
jgi:hypothetical protein